MKRGLGSGRGDRGPWCPFSHVHLVLGLGRGHHHKLLNNTRLLVCFLRCEIAGLPSLSASGRCDWEVVRNTGSLPTPQT